MRLGLRAKELRLEPVLFWTVFFVVLATVGLLARTIESAPFGDVTYVYLPWAGDVWKGYGVVGITSPWVYPIGALVPMAIAGFIGGSAHYVLGWFVLVAMLDGIALFLLRRASFLGRLRYASSWYFLAFMLALVLVSVSRIDGVVTPVVLVALVYTARSPRVAAIMLTIATWLKVWPAALIALAVLTLRTRKIFAFWFITLSVAITATAFIMGSGMNIFSFITQQSSRGLQLESVSATPYLWAAMFGDTGTHVYFDTSLVTYQVSGPLSDVIASLSTVILVTVMLCIGIVSFVQIRLGAPSLRVFSAAVLVATSSLMAFNKVGSPQFVFALVAPIVLGLCVELRFAKYLGFLGIALALLTGMVFPYFYAELLALSPAMVVVITIRNILFLAFVAVAFTQLLKSTT